MNPRPRYRRTHDEIEVSASSWLSLGQLRELVAIADSRRWADDALISHGLSDNHPTRRDLRTCQRLVIEGNDPE